MQNFPLVKLFRWVHYFTPMPRTKIQMSILLKVGGA